MKNLTISILFMGFNIIVLACCSCLMGCATVPKSVKNSFTLRYDNTNPKINTSIYHMEYKTFSIKSSTPKVLFDTFNNSYNFILYNDFTFLNNFSYKFIEGRKYVFGDWGVWTKNRDTITAQYMNDERKKFNKTFYVGEIKMLIKLDFYVKLISINNLTSDRQEAGKSGIVPGTAKIKPIELDSIPPPDSWLKTQEWIYKQPK